MNRKILTGIIILLALALASCSSELEAKTITLIAEDIVWDQTLIEAQAGQEVHLTIRNDGVLDHNFVSNELEINLHLSPGESESFTFILNKAGNYNFICSIPGHEDAGMVGEIVISE